MPERFVFFFADAAQDPKKPKLLRVKDPSESHIEERLADITGKPRGTIAFWLASEGITDPRKAAGEALQKGLKFFSPDDIAETRMVEGKTASMNEIVTALSAFDNFQAELSAASGDDPAYSRNFKKVFG